MVNCFALVILLAGLTQALNDANTRFQARGIGPSNSASSATTRRRSSGGPSGGSSGRSSRATSPGGSSDSSLSGRFSTLSGARSDSSLGNGRSLVSSGRAGLSPRPSSEPIPIPARNSPSSLTPRPNSRADLRAVPAQSSSSTGRSSLHSGGGSSLGLDALGRARSSPGSSLGATSDASTPGTSTRLSLLGSSFSSGSTVSLTNRRNRPMPDLEHLSTPNPSSQSEISRKSRASDGRDSPRPKKEDRSSEAYPVHIQTTIGKHAMLHVERGQPPVSEHYFGNRKTIQTKEFSDPRRLRLSLVSLQPDENQAMATGRKTKVTVEHTKSDPQGSLQSWSYAAGKKTKQTSPSTLSANLRASSSRIEAPVGVSGRMIGNGIMTLEASNSPSTSPPGSPGKQVPQLEHLYPIKRTNGPTNSASSSQTPKTLEQIDRPRIPELENLPSRTVHQR